MDNPADSHGDSVCDSNDSCPLDDPDDSDSDGACNSDDLCPGCDVAELGSELVTKGAHP